MTLADISATLEGLGVKVSRSAASKWETGETVPSAYQLVALFNALGFEDRISFFMDSYAPALNDDGLRKVEEYKADLIASGKYRPAPKISRVIRYIDMPVSNLTVSAGTGAFLDEGNFEMVSFRRTRSPKALISASGYPVTRWSLCITTGRSYGCRSVSRSASGRSAFSFMITKATSRSITSRSRMLTLPRSLPIATARYTRSP